MTQIDELITLDTNDNSKQMLFLVKYLVEENFTILISVVSNDYAGSAYFCFNKNDIDSFAKSLANMYDLLDGIAIINDTDSDGFIEFSIDDTGNVKACGQIGGTHSLQYLRFSFLTDQTVLPRFISNLNALCDHVDLE